jgi:hypothetical protein
VEGESPEGADALRDAQGRIVEKPRDGSVYAQFAGGAIILMKYPDLCSFGDHVALMKESPELVRRLKNAGRARATGRAAVPLNTFPRPTRATWDSIASSTPTATNKRGGDHQTPGPDGDDALSPEAQFS